MQSGATKSTVTLKKISTRDAATYTVSIKNEEGVVISNKAELIVE